MKKNGFTLVELLAVIVILAVVTSMASVGVSSLRKGINKSMWNSTVELIELVAEELRFVQNSILKQTKKEKNALYLQKFLME